jgi:hypothetical protein
VCDVTFLRSRNNNNNNPTAAAAAAAAAQVVQFPAVSFGT